MDYKTLKIGTKVFYTGDQANIEGLGEIVEVKQDQWYPVFYKIALEDGRIWNHTMPSAFEGSGKRFWVLEEYNEYRNKQMEALQKHLKSIK